MESILITGASGFIGSFIVEEALKRKFGVWAGIRSSSSREYLRNRKIHILELDFAHPNDYVRSFPAIREHIISSIISSIVPVSPNVPTNGSLTG